jgi:hypothetical protein
VGAERLPQQPLVLGERLAVALTQLALEPSRSLDVSEEEGDCAARKLSHCHQLSRGIDQGVNPAVSVD